MPYADRDKRIAATKRWRDTKMAEGYGQALYARRAQRYRNEEILRLAVIDAIQHLAATEPKKAMQTLVQALEDAPMVKGKPLDYMPKKGGKKK